MELCSRVRGVIMTEKIETYIISLIEKPEYAITGYVIGSDSIILFAAQIVAEQEEIPKSIDGRSVKIVKSI